MTNNIFIRLVPLPNTVRAFTTKDYEGNYNIYINDRLSLPEQEAEYLHELQHITDGDLERPIDIQEKELKMKGA